MRDNTNALYDSVRRIAFTQRTTGYTTASTTFAAAADIFTGGGATGAALTFTADGTSAYRIIYFCSQSDNLASGREIFISMTVGGTETGRMNIFGISSRTGNPVVYDRFLTPSAGSVTINMRAYHISGATLLSAGDGTSTNSLPMWLAVYGPALA